MIDDDYDYGDNYYYYEKTEEEEFVTEVYFQLFYSGVFFYITSLFLAARHD